MCQFGDGAISEGYFHECLNFCAVKQLPVVFLCENNGYGEYTPFQDVTASAPSSQGRGDGGSTETVDGMSVVEMRGCRSGGRACARGTGPYFLEAVTAATSATHGATPARTARGSSTWKERDPIPRLRHELEDAGVAPSALDAILKIDALYEIERKGLEAPFPEAGRVRVQRMSAGVDADAPALGLDDRGGDRRVAEASGRVVRTR